MRPLKARELLEVWEAGLAQAPTERALALLAAACPEASPDALATLTIGQRDGKLLTLREGLWGSKMAAVVVCPGCQERLELILEAPEMLAHARHSPAAEIPLSVGEYHVSFRLPTCRDVLAVVGHATPDARAVLFERCLVSAERGGAPLDSDKLPPNVVTAVEKAVEEADPLADIQLGVTCPSCEHQWRALFDIVSFLWTEIEVWAWRILTDVHTLARAYGWSEGDILNLSPTRRQFYLDMVGA
jgi:hypothetical protein